jgi:hypothetical protein
MKAFFTLLAIAGIVSNSSAQSNIAENEPVQIVGPFNSYSPNPYNSDYRTTSFGKISTTLGNFVDGRCQWATTINVQNSGGNITPTNLTGGPGNGFQFISGPAANRFQNRWVFQFAGQAAVDQINNITQYSSTGAGVDMGVNMSSTGHYTYVFNDAGYSGFNAKYYIG